MTASFVEVTSPGWAFWRSLLDTCIGLIVGTLYTFIGLLVMGLVGEEALSSIYWDLDLDPLFRASVGVILVAGAVLGLGVPFIVSGERFAAMRAVERSAAQHPDGVPQRRLRDELTSPPLSQLRLTGRIVLWCGVGACALVLLGLAFVEDLREDEESWIALAASVGLAVVGAVVAGMARSGAERAEDRLTRLRSRWGSLVPTADAADLRRREALVEVQAPRWLAVPGPRLLDGISRVLIAAALVSFGALFLSVFMRQQCRECEPVYWDEPIENGIDVLSLGSGVAVAVCASVSLIAWIGGVALQLFRERALAQWCRDGGPRRVDLKLVTPLLAENRASVRLQQGLTVVGSGMIIVGVGALWGEWNRIDPQLAAGLGSALIVLGFLIGWADAGRSARERQIIRDALRPGDAGRESEDGGRVKPHRRRRRPE